MARKRYNFWLNDQLESDWPINELITNLKKAGQFTRAIREGLRLWVSLREGDTTVLFELFPSMKTKLTIGGAGGGGLEDLNAKLELLIAQATTGGYMMQTALPTMKPVEAPPVAFVQQAAPVDADSIADNFLNAFL